MVTNGQRDRKIASALRRIWGASSKKNIQIVEQVRDLMIVHKDPLHQVCNGIKNVGCRAKAERESQIHIKMMAPFHSQQVPIQWMDRNVAVGRLHIKLGHKCPTAKLGN